MAQVRFVSYLTLDGSGRMPLADALAAQRAAVVAHLAGCGGHLIAEVREIRLAGFDPGRTELQRALALCQRHGAILLVAALAPLARDPAFLANLRRDLERMDLRFVAADMPEVDADTLGILAAVAAYADGPAASGDRLARERAFFGRLAERRREAAPPGPQAEPAEAPAGSGHNRPCMKRTLERARNVAPILAEIRAAGATTFEQVAHALNELGVPSARGDRWYPSQVRRVEQRIAALA